jgi:serine/threonine protein kinase/Tol biopolymer transport system component
MTPERWQQIERLYHAALERAQAERAAFLDAVCADDADLRAEVDSLLAAAARGDTFLEASALQVTARALASELPRLTVGQRVGSYEILAPLGAGGMSEVYTARDTRLGRTVAVKVLSPAYADNVVWRQRFERESRALAALSHAHICPVFDVGREGTVDFLVMEYLEGETLAARLANGPLPLDQALRYGIEIADALAQAHRRGVFHRDLKPGNIMLTRSGVSLLDFGLARMELNGSSSEHVEQGDARLTTEGVILGTLHYLSPEQLNGGKSDGRSDIFAFGAVLHEMLTAQRAFDGASRAMVIAAILEHAPLPVSDVQHTAPAALDRVIRKALAKDPDERWQDAGDLRDELKWIAEDALNAGAKPSVTSRLEAREIAPWILFAIASVALLVLSAMHFSEQPANQVAPRILRMTMASSGTAALDIAEGGRSLAITPDGTRVAYVGSNNQLFVRPLDRLDATSIFTGAAPLTWVFTSPDGRWVGFVEGVVLKKVALTGGPPVTIAHAGALLGATWAPDDTIIFATSDPATGLQRVSAAGGGVSGLTQPAPAQGELDHLWPEMLPGGRAVLMTITATSGGLAAAQVAVLDLATGTHTVLVRGGSHGHYVNSGHLVYTAEGALRAVPFDLTRLETRGTPVTVLSRLVTTPRGSGDFVVAADGTLVYADALGATAAERTLVWVDRQGREEALAAPPRPYFQPRLSPDGTRVAVAVADQENDIWVWDLARHTLSQITFDPAADFAPVWTHDGRRLVFYSQRGREPGLFSQLADGSGKADRLSAGAPPTGVTPDGAQVLFASTGNRDLAMVALDGTRRVQSMLQNPSVERNGIVSPDGRWLAYESDSSGRFEIYVRPFPNVGAGQWLASSGGGTRPLWAPNGQELFYVAPGGALMARRVYARDGAWSAGSPTKVVDGPYATEGVRDRRTYDVSTDGKRFLMIKQPSNEATAPQIIVVQHWLEELKRLVPRN